MQNNDNDNLEKFENNIKALVKAQKNAIQTYKIVDDLKKNHFKPTDDEDLSKTGFLFNKHKKGLFGSLAIIILLIVIYFLIPSQSGIEIKSTQNIFVFSDIEFDLSLKSQINEIIADSNYPAKLNIFSYGGTEEIIIKDEDDLLEIDKNLMKENQIDFVKVSALFDSFVSEVEKNQYNDFLLGLNNLDINELIASKNRAMTSDDFETLQKLSSNIYLFGTYKHNKMDSLLANTFEKMQVTYNKIKIEDKSDE